MHLGGYTYSHGANRGFITFGKSTPGPLFWTTWLSISGFQGGLAVLYFFDFCVFLIVPEALGPLPSDRAHREDSDGMENVFWDALGPEL